MSTVLGRGLGNVDGEDFNRANPVIRSQLTSGNYCSVSSSSSSSSSR